MFYSSHHTGTRETEARLQAGRTGGFSNTCRCRINVCFSRSYILAIFPHRRDRKETEVWSKLHCKFVIDKRCLSFTQTYRCKFSVTQQTDRFGCQNKIVSRGAMPEFSVLSLSVIRYRKSIKFIAAKFSSTSTALLEKVVHSAVPATVSCSEVESLL